MKKLLLTSGVIIAVIAVGAFLYFNTVNASTGRIDPSGETCVGIACSGWNQPVWSKINQPSVTNPSVPSLLNPATVGVGDGDDLRINIAMSDLSGVTTATAVDVNVYASGTKVDLYLHLFANGVEVGSQQFFTPTVAGWGTVSWTGLSLSQSDVNSIQIQLDPQLNDPPPGGVIAVYAMYANITYTGGGGGTTQSLWQFNDF